MSLVKINLTGAILEFRDGHLQFASDCPERLKYWLASEERDRELHRFYFRSTPSVRLTGSLRFYDRLKLDEGFDLTLKFHGGRLVFPESGNFNLELNAYVNQVAADVQFPDWSVVEFDSFPRGASDAAVLWTPHSTDEGGSRSDKRDSAGE